MAKSKFVTGAFETANPLVDAIQSLEDASAHLRAFEAQYKSTTLIERQDARAVDMAVQVNLHSARLLIGRLADRLMENDDS